MKGHNDWNESFVQKVIADDPSVLGLGDLILIDRERKQLAGGRLDLLLRDESDDKRFAVEVQLGKTDPSHIIRTIEYWDLEKKRRPSIPHVAVIVAEEVEARFFNVIALFNQAIPIIAIKMSALHLDGAETLIFTKVLDHASRPMDATLDVVAPVDRAYWERTAPAACMRIADGILTLVRSFCPSVEFSYKKPYIGTLVDNEVSNFAVLRPQKRWLKLSLRLDQSAETDQSLEAAGFDFEYAVGAWPQYRIRILESDIDEHRDLITALLKNAYSKAEDVVVD